MPLSEADVEKAYFTAKGFIARPQYRGPDGKLMDVPPPDPVHPADVVRQVVHKYELPANVVWDHTIPDLFIMLRPPDDASTTADDKGGQLMVLINLDERMKMLERLSVWERIELEAWKAELM